MKSVMKIEVGIDDLIVPLRYEILSNIEEYKGFVLNSVNIPFGLNRYIENPLENYDTSSCHVYIIAIANYYRVNIKILHADNSRCSISHIQILILLLKKYFILLTLGCYYTKRCMYKS